MKRNTRKHPTAILTLDDMRKQAQEDARALVISCNGQNKAAKYISMSKGRFSFIVHGKWTQVAVNEIDLAMLATGRAISETYVTLTDEARQLFEQRQKQLAELHDTDAQLLRVLRKL